MFSTWESEGSLLSSLRDNPCCNFNGIIFYCYRSDSRKKHLKEAFDRMVRFHEDMINALTWLTSAESKVAELDSAVEATSTEEQQDMEALRKELKVRLIFRCFVSLNLYILIVIKILFLLEIAKQI